MQFAPLHYSRSEMGAEPDGVLDVTVTVRQIPLVTAGMSHTSYVVG